MNWPLFNFALIFLVTGSYLDNLRGPLLPLLTHSLKIPYSQTIFLYVAGSVGAIFMALLLKILSRRKIDHSIKSILAVSLLASASAPWISNLITLIAFSFLVGASVAGFGTLSNILMLHATESRHRARSYCALHTMYGLASAIGPTVIAKILGLQWRWQQALWPCVILTALSFLAPVGNISSQSEETSKPKNSKTPGQWVAIIAFVVYVLGEVLASIWMVAFLVEARAFSIQSASPYLTGFFLCMAISRLCCILKMDEKRERFLLWASQISFVSFIILGILVHPLFFSLSGVVGPFFPLLMARITRVFGKNSPQVIIKVFLALPIALSLANFSMGQFTRIATIETLYWIPVIFAVLTLPILRWYFKVETTNLPTSG